MPVLAGIVLEEPTLPRVPASDVGVDERTSQLTVEAEERVIRWVEDLALYRDNHVLRDSGPPPIEVETGDLPYSAPIHRGYTTRVGVSPLMGRVPSAVSISLRRPVNLYTSPLAEHYSPYHFVQWAWPYHGPSAPSPYPLGGTTRAMNNDGKVITPLARYKTATDPMAPPPTFSKVICPPRRTNNGIGQAISAAPRHADVPAFVYRPGTYSSALAPEGDDVIPVPPRRREVIVQLELADTQPELICRSRRSSSSASTPSNNLSSPAETGSSALLTSSVDMYVAGEGSYIAWAEGHPARPPRSAKGPYKCLTPNQTNSNINKATAARMEELDTQYGTIEDAYALQLLPWCLGRELDIQV